MGNKSSSETSTYPQPMLNIYNKIVSHKEYKAKRNLHSREFNELIVYGFVRNHEKRFSNRKTDENERDSSSASIATNLQIFTIPEDINKLILKFFNIRFDWNDTDFNTSEVVQFVEENPAMIKFAGNGKWGMIAIGDQISIHSCNNIKKQFEWEFEIHESFGTYFSFMFGFVSADISHETLSKKLNREHISNSWMSPSTNKLNPCGIQVFTQYPTFNLYGRDGHDIKVKLDESYAGGKRMSLD